MQSKQAVGISYFSRTILAFVTKEGPLRAGFHLSKAAPRPCRSRLGSTISCA